MENIKSFPYTFCVVRPTPESVRWLASKGRYAEADSIIRKVAKFNRIVINEALEDRVDLVPGKAEESVRLLLHLLLQSHLVTF